MNAESIDVFENLYWSTGIEGDRRPEEEYEHKGDQVYRIDSFCYTGEQDIADEQRLPFDER